MRTMRWVLMAALAAAAAGCGSVVVQPGPGDAAAVDVPATSDTPAPPPDARRTCTSSADCAPGEECYIAEGCAVPSVCGPALGRPCTDDLAAFCGCDGQTFSSSSSCPSRTYAHRGPCEAADGGPGGCAFPDGRVCPFGQTCPAGDGCNSCSCGRDGTIACTGLACVDAGPPVDVPAPGSCRSGADCPPSMMCDGPAGCGVPWSCVPPHPCTADVAPFCGCDGATFYGSSSCPGQMYQSRGACPAADGGAVACRAQDARGDGLCDAIFGYAWNGMTCVGVTGCRCVGADCGALLRDPAACRARYAACGG